MSKYVIVDANSFVHKAYHGYEPQIDRRGNDNRVLFGLMKTISDLPKHIENINFLFVVFDPPDGHMYRKAVFPAYKANRPPPIEDLVKQKDYAKKVLENNIGIPVINFNGYEADDIIGSLSHLYSKDDKNEIIIVSPDKDLFQLVGKNVNILRPFKNKISRGYELITESGVETIFGVPASLIPDFLALMGDVSDNLPGIDKVGAVTAAKLLKKYNSLEHLIAIAHEIKGLIGENIRNAIPLLRIVRGLTEVKVDLPLLEIVNLALVKAIKIQDNANYKKNLDEMKEFFNWYPDMVDIFME